VNRPKQIRRTLQVLDRQTEKHFLSGDTLPRLAPDRRIIGRAILDGVLKDRRIRGEPGD
jgi:hypothetical protein